MCHWRGGQAEVVVGEDGLAAEAGGGVLGCDEDAERAAG